MKRFLSVFLTASLVFSSFLTVFAGEKSAIPSDVTGLPCEASVTTLMQEGVISGYPDGTFRPAAAINRAEACVVAVKSMKVSDGDLASAGDSGFADLSGYSWAKEYIDYGVKQGLISGYPDGSFRPAAPVTENEMSAMLIHSIGYSNSDVEGAWPANYYAKAVALGLYQSMDAPKTAADADRPATRGDVAMMTDHAMHTAAHNGSQGSGNTQTVPGQPTAPGNLENSQSAANQPGAPNSSGDSAQSGATNQSGNSPQSGGTEQSGSDADAASRFVPESNANYYGMITDVSQILSDGQPTQGITFLFGSKTGQLVCENDGVADGVKPSDYLNGQLYQIKVRNHRVQTVSAVGTGGSGAHEITDGFTPVTAVGDTSIQLGNRYYPFADRTVVYTAVFNKDGDLTGYRESSARSITVGSDVRAYDMDKGSGSIGVAVLVKPGDVSKL